MAGVDWRHAKLHLTLAATALHGEGTAAARRWVRDQETPLLQGHAERLARTLLQLAQKHTRCAEAYAAKPPISAHEYVKYGQFSFEVNGESAKLQVYQDPDSEYFFLPFVDATTPEETYGAGRYYESGSVQGWQVLVGAATPGNDGIMQSMAEAAAGNVDGLGNLN